MGNCITTFSKCLYSTCLSREWHVWNKADRAQMARNPSHLNQVLNHVRNTSPKPLVAEQYPVISVHINEPDFLVSSVHLLFHIHRFKLCFGCHLSMWFFPKLGHGENVNMQSIWSGLFRFLIELNHNALILELLSLWYNSTLCWCCITIAFLSQFSLNHDMIVPSGGVK